MRCSFLSQNICRIPKASSPPSCQAVLLLLVTQGLDQGGELWFAVPKCQWCQTLQQHPRQLLLQPRASTRASVGLSWRHSPVSLLFPLGMRLRLAPTHVDAACAPWRAQFQQSHPSRSLLFRFWSSDSMTSNSSRSLPSMEESSFVGAAAQLIEYFSGGVWECSRCCSPGLQLGFWWVDS